MTIHADDRNYYFKTLEMLRKYNNCAMNTNVQVTIYLFVAREQKSGVAALC